MKTVIGGEVAPTALDKSECFVQTDGVCSTKEVVNEMHRFLKKEHSIDVAKNPKELVEVMKNVLGVDTEAEILQHRDFSRYIGTREAQKELENNFKEKGPNDSTALLDNFNIDGTLHKWAKHSQKLFFKKKEKYGNAEGGAVEQGKRFYHIPFQMIDFEKVGSELSRISIPELIKGGYDCFGCVLNTDVSTGGGKHWFCIFGDLEHTGTENDPFVIEFFNSSGNPPVREVNLWMENTCADIMKTIKLHAKTLRAAPKRLQYSQTECGMWSLMYIKSRLENKKPDYFYKSNANDTDMIKFRKYMFRGV